MSINSGIVNGCRNIGAEKEQMVLEGLQAAYHPYVRDRGLDWEIHIEEVSLSVLELGARSVDSVRRLSLLGT